MTIPANSAQIPDGSPLAHPVYLVDASGNGLSGTNAMPIEDIEAAGYIALVSPPVQTNAGTETILTFSGQVNRVELYNGSGANLNYAFDTTVTPGSTVLPSGYQLDKAKKVTAVHLLTTAATNINGATAGNIIVLGSL